MIDLLKEFGEVKENVSLKNYNTYKINGSAKYLISPSDEDNLISLIKCLKDNSISYFIIGNGSNIIIPDEFYDGVIIKLDCLNDVTMNGTTVYAQSGIMMPVLARKTFDNNLAGLEWASSIPGTLGGSIVGNAGAYKEEIFDYIDNVRVLDSNLNIKAIKKEDLKYSYRYSSFKDHKDLIILGATLNLRNGNKEESLEIVNKRMQKRLETQPLEYPSAGSVFRNRENDFAGRIIEEALGFKGKEIGGAKVSEKHANFIINFNNATSKDIKELISLIKEEVKEKDNIDLVIEQEIIEWKEYMTKRKKRIRFKSVLFLLLLGYLVFVFGMYIYKLPVKNIYIKGTSILTDQEIIDAAKLKSYPSIHKYSNRKIAKNIKALELVDDVKIRKNIFGKVTITVNEAKPLFYYRSDDKIVLSNKKMIPNNSKYVGIPILINYVPKKILNDLITYYAELDDDVVKQINEIEYNPDKKEGITLDENRFVLRMNDTNTVYIDSLNIAKLNNYQKIIAALEDGVHGYIYLNSNRDNASFQAYQETPAEEQAEEVENNEG